MTGNCSPRKTNHIPKISHAYLYRVFENSLRTVALIRRLPEQMNKEAPSQFTVALTYREEHLKIKTSRMCPLFPSHLTRASTMSQKLTSGIHPFAEGSTVSLIHGVIVGTVMTRRTLHLRDAGHPHTAPRARATTTRASGRPHTTARCPTRIHHKMLQAIQLRVHPQMLRPAQFPAHHQMLQAVQFPVHPQTLRPAQFPVHHRMLQVTNFQNIRGLMTTRLEPTLRFLGATCRQCRSTPSFLP